jgi:Transcriptional antiterminator
MPESVVYVHRGLNNNAVLASDGTHEFVLVGRGIGFKAKVGESLRVDEAEKAYHLLDSAAKTHYLDLVNRVDPDVFEAVSQAIDFAGDLLGRLHPSLYVMLTDHLAFAIERLREGIVVHNPLLQEIKSVFPDEFRAAELVLTYLNSSLDVPLPHDEAAFITRHLNAARRGSTVKEPLRDTNAVSDVVAQLQQALDIEIPAGEQYDRVVSHVSELRDRMRRGQLRSSPLAFAIARGLPSEWRVAGTVLNALAAQLGCGVPGAGERAFVSFWLHGWLQDIAAQSSTTAPVQGCTD